MHCDNCVAYSHSSEMLIWCRKAIRETGMPAAAELADKPELALREAVRESDLLMHCKGAFIVGSTGNDGQDALRRLVVELFQASAACKLRDLMKKRYRLTAACSQSTSIYTEREAASVAVLVSSSWSSYQPPITLSGNAFLLHKDLCMPAGE